MVAARRTLRLTGCVYDSKVSYEAAENKLLKLPVFCRLGYRFRHSALASDHRFLALKAATVLYGMTGFSEAAALLAKLGIHITGEGCRYLKKLADVDQHGLEALVVESLAAKRAHSSCGRNSEGTMVADASKKQVVRLRSLLAVPRRPLKCRLRIVAGWSATRPLPDYGRVARYPPRIGRKYVKGF
jgi:hypothetical protein